MKSHQKFISSDSRNTLKLLIQMSVVAIIAMVGLFICQTSAQMQSKRNSSLVVSPQAGGNVDSDFNVQAEVNPFGNVSSVYTSAVLPSGQILIGERFNSIASTARSNIARLNSDGTLDTTFNASANEYIQKLVVQPDGKILIGGDFTVINGVPRNHIARLNADGSIDASFNRSLQV